MKWKNLNETRSYREMNHELLTDELTGQRMKTWRIHAGAGLDFYYGASRLSKRGIDCLQNLADEQHLIDKYKALLSGERMNTGEDRYVLHHLTRGELAGPVMEHGRNIGEFYRQETRRIRTFCEKIHAGEILGSTGKRFDTVVQIGIGGSDLGPRALYMALRGLCPPQHDAHFVSNIDPDDVAEVIGRIDPETTLFILVSKSGTTQETLANRDFLLKQIEMRRIAGYDGAGHVVAVTSRTSPLANSGQVLDSFFIDDFIGGRFSSTSAVGGVVLSLCFGSDVFDEILKGAHEADTKAMAANIRDNAALMDAMLGVFYRNILHYPATVILPYSQALIRFPAHLQQLDMESNGKSSNRLGQALTYRTGPIVFGEPGTNGQHSFYQLLHQGSDMMSLQFIGFRKPQRGIDIVLEGSTNQAKLNANLAAQIIAFARGRGHADSNKNFPGRRPSTLLAADRLTPRVLGALLSHYENKIMFQGFCWNLNSFDQEGVQLGKILTRAVLSGSSDDDALKTCAEILGV